MYSVWRRRFQNLRAEKCQALLTQSNCSVKRSVNIMQSSVSSLSNQPKKAKSLQREIGAQKRSM
jgi:hypothetical protein